MRAQRRQWHLSQKELAFLFGYKNESIVSRLERHERSLTFATLRACIVIFGSGIDDIFPALSKEADNRLLQRMHELRAELERSGLSRKTETKLRLLQAAIARLAEGEVEQPIV
jgi:transcriptional regulator with XRE-family HTH domain